MYGDIASWSEVSASSVKKLFDELKKQGIESATVRLHSPGGNVFEGIAIKNTIASSGIEVEFIIEGIAASMATQIMLAGTKIKAYKDAKIMIHEAKSAVLGGANRLRSEAELLDKVNNDMAENYSQKTGKPKDWILQNWMQEGKDKWFSAKEAQEMGLIDEVIMQNRLPQAEFSEYSQMVAFYNENLLETINDMQKVEKLLALFGKSAQASENENLELLEASIKEVLQEKNLLEQKMLQDKINLLREEMQAKGLATKQQEAFLELAKTNFEAVKAIISAMPSQRVQLQNSQKPAENRENWTYEDWERKDPEGLLAMMNQEPEKYNTLLEKFLKV
jgi:ATP-dependent Clp endopeptidase proteolytic subunit ClpP